MHVQKPTLLLAAAKKARPQLQVLWKNSKIHENFLPSLYGIYL